MASTKMLVIAAATAAIATACATADTPPAPPSNDPLPAPAATAKQPTALRPPQVTQERACGAFTAIDNLAHNAITPAPDPGNPDPRPNGTNIITYASALQTLDRHGLSAPMNAALSAHAYALTNLGALINHKASREDIDSMATVADTTSHTVQALCDQAP